MGKITEKTKHFNLFLGIIIGKFFNSYDLDFFTRGILFRFKKYLESNISF